MMKRTTITEISKQDIITSDASYMIAHCISRDCALGVGIAAYLDRLYGIKRALRDAGFNKSRELVCITRSGSSRRLVASMVTKELYYNKPTYQTLQAALFALRDMMHAKNITRLALPKIGCGCDMLDWPIVRSCIYKTFDSTDGFDILIYT